MSHFKFALLFTAFAFILAACSQMPDVPQADTPEPLPLTTAAASSPYTQVSWFKGQGSKTLIPEWQGFCWLTGIQGRLADTIDYARVYTSAGQWKVKGFGAVEWASATCVNWSGLTSNSSQMPPAVPIRSITSEVGGYFIPVPYPGTGDLYCPYGPSPYVLLSTHAHFLTGFGGNWTRSNTIYTGAYTLEGGVCNENFDDLRPIIYGSARGWLFGSGNANTFWSDPKFDSRPELKSQPIRTFDLAPTDEAFCYFSDLAGVFNDTTDYANIWRGLNESGKEVWKLTLRRKPSNVLSIDVDYLDYLAASIRCPLLHQTN